MKEQFFDAKIEIILFPEADIITTSGNGYEEDELPWFTFND